MTFEEAIKHAEEVAKENQERANSNILIERNGTKFLYDGEEYKKCYKCAEEHRQLAEWLKDYQRLLDDKCQQNEDTIKTLEQEPKTGHWIKYGIPICGEQHYKCTSCGYYINFGQWGELYTKEFKYCPNCGAKMIEPQESEEGMSKSKFIVRMKEQQFIISEEQILDAVKYALKSNIKEHRIVDILMQDVKYIIEKVLPDECEKVQIESEDKNEDNNV